MKPQVRPQAEDMKRKQKNFLVLCVRGHSPHITRDITSDTTTTSKNLPIDLAAESVDLVLVLDFPEPRIREDEGGRVYEQLMHTSSLIAPCLLSCFFPDNS